MFLACLEFAKRQGTGFSVLPVSVRTVLDHDKNLLTYLVLLFDI